MFEASLLALIAKGRGLAYAAQIRRDYEIPGVRRAEYGAVHASLNRLENKNLVFSEMSAPQRVRGGRRRRLYALTAEGWAALEKIQIEYVRTLSDRYVPECPYVKARLADLKKLD